MKRVASIWSWAGQGTGGWAIAKPIGSEARIQYAVEIQTLAFSIFYLCEKAFSLISVAAVLD